MTRTIAGAIAAATLAASFAAQADAPPGDAARGKGLFTKNLCYTCHGTLGQGSQYGVPLAPHVFPWEAFLHQVRSPRSSMPPYSPQAVSDAELADIYAYVASIRAGKKASEIPLLKD